MIQQEPQAEVSYLRVYRNDGNEKSAADQADEELDNKGEEIIASDKLEHKKNKFKVLREIYDHTERKVLQNQQKIVDLQNKNPDSWLQEADLSVK